MWGVGGEDLCDSLEIPQAERKGWRIIAGSYYRAQDETGSGGEVKIFT